MSILIYHFLSYNYYNESNFNTLIKKNYTNEVDIPDFSEKPSKEIYYDKYCIRPELDICLFSDRYFEAVH